MNTEEDNNDHLLKIMDVAVARLERDGQLIPFRAIIGAQGRIEIEDLPNPALSDSDGPMGAEMSALRDEAMARGAVACAIVADVLRPEVVTSAFEDTIAIRFESKSTSVLVFFPYHMPIGLIARALLCARITRREARFDGHFVFNVTPKIFLG